MTVATISLKGSIVIPTSYGYRLRAGDKVGWWIMGGYC